MPIAGSTKGFTNSSCRSKTAYAHGGLLTTVGDLLIWNKALDEERLASVRYQGARDTLHCCRAEKPTVYARGLFVRSDHGVRELSHDGATAGYRAWLGRFPGSAVVHCRLMQCRRRSSVETRTPLWRSLYLPTAAQAKALYTLKPPPVSRASTQASAMWCTPASVVPRRAFGDRPPAYTIRMGSCETFAFILVRTGVIAETGALLPDGRMRRDNEGDATFLRSGSSRCSHTNGSRACRGKPLSQR